MRRLSVVVHDIETRLERCLETGGKVVTPIREWSPTVKMMILEDPESSCWREIASIDRHEPSVELSAAQTSNA